MTNTNSNPVGNPVITGMTSGLIILSSGSVERSEDRGEFDRFEDLASKPVHVSKDDSDTKAQSA
jgi:hypothetical protein